MWNHVKVPEEYNPGTVIRWFSESVKVMPNRMRVDQWTKHETGLSPANTSGEDPAQSEKASNGLVDDDLSRSGVKCTGSVSWRSRPEWVTVSTRITAWTSNQDGAPNFSERFAAAEGSAVSPRYTNPRRPVYRACAGNKVMAFISVFQLGATVSPSPCGAFPLA